MGIFYAADFFTLFFFFEIMSFTSFMWIVHIQTSAGSSLYADRFWCKGRRVSRVCVASDVLYAVACSGDSASLGSSRQDGHVWNPSFDSVAFVSERHMGQACISIAVGIVIYILAVRFLMLRRKDQGYRELFPAWLDMEKYVYRAVFYRFIPLLLGISARILDSLVDAIVVILRKTVYCDRPLPYELPEGNPMTHVLGKSMERARRLYCAVTKKEYTPKNYEHKLALKSMDLFENVRIIERSLSFGFLMFCIGLGLTMIYLLAVN